MRKLQNEQHQKILFAYQNQMNQLKLQQVYNKCLNIMLYYSILINK
jgi:hypothetical protein